MTVVFVFGSNLAGRHGAGAALDAFKFYGARYGQGTGRQGRSYAIPTKDAKLKPLPLSVIQEHVETFLNYARAHQDETFMVTRVGCGLAGYNEQNMAPMFASAPQNCTLPEGWRDGIRTQTS